MALAEAAKAKTVILGESLSFFNGLLHIVATGANVMTSLTKNASLLRNFCG
tara:strand:+ start:517 stop:669 length:153 start_codon:yes stop_codon:yes gene_type:complete